MERIESMDRTQLDRYLSAYTTDASCKELVYTLADKGAIDERKVRDELINRDFVLHMQKGTAIMDIYAYISVTYDISEYRAMEIVKNKT